MFDKICRTCEKPFQHPSRNAKYCPDNPKCLEAARKRNHSRGKRKRNYRKDPEMFRRMSMSRKQAREQCIAAHAISCCTRCGNPFQIKNLEDHHRDGDPFNNVDENLTLLCKKCHSKSDTEWRKAKEQGMEIIDVSQFTQIGVLLRNKDGFVYFAQLGGDRYGMSMRDQDMLQDEWERKIKKAASP